MASLIPFQIGLKLMGLAFGISKKLRKEIYNPSINYAFNNRIQIRTMDGTANIWIEFKNGKMRSGTGPIDHPDLVLEYSSKDIMANAIKYTPDISLDLLLSGDLEFVGNMATLGKFSYLTTIFPKKVKRPLSPSFPPQTRITEEQAAIKKIDNEVLGRQVDAVKYLADPYLGKLSISDFPWLLERKNRFFTERAEVCTERAKNLTDFFVAEGFENRKDGQPWDASLRNGLALKHVLAMKAPVIHEGDLLPGSTTSKRLGVQLFPEFGAVMLWPELHTVHARPLNPYIISEDDKAILNEYVYPFWIDRNIREYTRKKYGNALCQRIDDKFAYYFMWKTQAISHTIPNWSTLLSKGIGGIIADIDEKAAGAKDGDGRAAFYAGAKAALEGILAYTRNLHKEAQRQVDELQARNDPALAGAIENLYNILHMLDVVPEHPARSFREAITAIWIVWVALHNENMNAGLSLGRLDQVLYPYFEHDMKIASSLAARELAIKEAITLIGAFYLKCGDHLPLVPNVGNKLFGGSSSDQALTLGGITPSGENAVNDLTYMFLKVTEMLSIRDPNVNARYHVDKNSPEYLRRLLEVNINTTATPSIHNDKVMIDTLVSRGFALEDARDWAATGCVEPTMIGRHFGHTNCMLCNLVAPLEVLMNGGRHPRFHYPINENLTPAFTAANFPTFDALLGGYKSQLAFLIAKSIEINNMYGTVHQEIKPTPLLSSLIDGAIEKGKDVVHGSARYNSSGVAMVALVDVVDSLMALKKVVYEWKKIDLDQFKVVLERDFTGEGDKAILEHIKRVPKFGSNDPEVNKLAKELIAFINEEYARAKNYRGGNYLVGFWSMSNHTAFGKLSGTMPSGRLRGKAFTPGITPAPGSSDQLLDNIKTVASLDAKLFSNNIAFNVKLVPSGGDTHEQTLDHFYDYSRSYFDLGGLQMQFNVVTTAMMRDAMLHPENYRWLMVRISGYNAYFTELNKDMQIELIERMEFKA
ncbi:MAG: pyruvate formate lyase family protein [Candidatus Sigynarchaeota archaeon]